MSEHIAASLARLIRKRARDICEYCHLPQSSQEATFHVDHVLPVSARGPTTADNLALACVTCSLRKTPKGRATIAALGMNRPAVVVIRRTLAALGRFPPTTRP
jgi:5-methylcytosine-specific restriction endonuclease McrA